MSNPNGFKFYSTEEKYGIRIDLEVNGRKAAIMMPKMCLESEEMLRRALKDNIDDLVSLLYPENQRFIKIDFDTSKGKTE